MSLASLIPDTQVEPALLPALLPWSVRYNFLYPYCDLFSHIVPTQPGPPRWNAELEAFYQTFDGGIWFPLGRDHDEDLDAIENLRDRIGRLRRAKRLADANGGASLADLEGAIETIRSRIHVRRSKLLGLHEVRDVFLHDLQERYPCRTEVHLLKTQPAMSFSPPFAAPHSLWPIPLKRPSYYRADHKARLICLTTDGVNWTKYALPDRPTPDSEAARRRFEPTVTKMLGDAEESVESGWAEATMDDTRVPLRPHSNGARSSGFIPAFTSLLHRRHPQVA
ncbi:hypothetical protein NBRC10512_003849 [Rhodotorula toruloides]|uniref:RHTO0S02e04500g1_1 n=2 Tax=Rhodotorula toruloides TaxID=5286 RepID=A0A061AGE1_RHOTO|nr:uncharacterized protein RHTO_01171 [Rhodotorula toruloides NP11]EMS21956.1 hypothetical protein RHTO_01171 [Rhodotorula toruloides NP11]CDR36611.1 RHTO0S02e04500g1_1 [Rhodotorula toruloides]